MADFDPAIDFVLPHEGGYVNDPADAGGETKYGISKRSYPDVDIASLTVDDAKAIYKHDWWDKQRYAEINDQGVANKVLDLAINMGFHAAHKIIQLACGDCGNPTTCDGDLGPNSIAAINASDPQQLLTDIKSRAKDYYQTLAINKPSNLKFLRGWLDRADA